LGIVGGHALSASAQPDPRQMAGIPRPVDDLPDGSVSVRVIRGSFANNIANQPVQLQVGSEILTVNTDAEGRAQFDKLTAGATARASAVVDGERIESEPFPAPARGGIRLVLLASGGASGPGGPPAGAASAPALPGTVSIGGQSRVIVQPGDDSVTVYYLLEIVNPASTPVTPAQPFAFELPAGTTRTEIMQGSSVAATVSGRRVQAGGPFQPGINQLNVGSEMPHAAGTLEISQLFPAAINQFALIVQKVGNTTVSSPYISQQREVAQQGEVYIAGAGSPVPEGQPLVLTVTNMPHHSAVPRRLAITLSLVILIAGFVAAARPPDFAAARGTERRRLLARREKLLGELVRLERDQRRHRAASEPPDEHYLVRRDGIVSALEHVYGALDSDDLGAGSESTTVAAR
jgi:hypothetical protein